MLEFKRELAEDGEASFSARYVKFLRGGNCPVEALFVKKLIEDKLIWALVYSGSSVSLLSDTIKQQLGVPSQIRVCNKNIIAANNGKMPVTGSTAFQIQLQKPKSETTVEFLVNKIEVTPCLLGMGFVFNFDCILNTRKNVLFCEKIGKILQWSPSP